MLQYIKVTPFSMAFPWHNFGFPKKYLSCWRNRRLIGTELTHVGLVDVYYLYNINNRPLVPNIQQKIVYLLLSTITVIRIVQDLSDIERSGQELQDSSAPLSTVHSRRSRYPYIFNKIFPVWKCVHKYAILFKTAHTFINYMKSVDKMMCDYIVTTYIMLFPKPHSMPQWPYSIPLWPSYMPLWPNG